MGLQSGRSAPGGKVHYQGVGIKEKGSSRTGSKV